MSVVACSDCGRVLWVKDGPTCPECVAKRPKPKQEPKQEPKAKPQEAEAKAE
jgi:uncharacterized Zn finger protein (UPF0148 family)